ncbi:unnamed protein product [Calicophoron daubneyi]|uniref:Chorein N-terminal domain-containing protein n=1 Tax=Calicophoron daubneyi TaxID=300641 RepID=A0AAV2TJE5_CALDB
MQRYFKLETYLGKWIMSYLNEYVKLRDDQVAMSMWEGDVILHHLELRCESLNHLIPLPVAVRSGQVHELRIHVPWTKLNSENITVSLNTVECILVLNQPSPSVQTEIPVIARSSTPVDSSQISSEKTRDLSTPAPPSYLESYINRLLANIRFVVHNLNAKFIQDDIVLSLSSDLLDFYPTTQDWKPTFHVNDLDSSYIVRRKLQVADLTLCLDHAGPDGYVEAYEDPLTYRLSCSCLIELVYPFEFKGSFSPLAAVTTISLHLKSLDTRVSPSQIHALLRLLDVCVAVHTGTVNWSSVGSTLTNIGSFQGTERESQSTTSRETRDHSSLDTGHTNDIQEQSWASWMWSFVPTILPPTTDASDSDDENSPVDLITNPREAAIELVHLVYEDAKAVISDTTEDFNSERISTNSFNTIDGGAPGLFAQLDSGFELVSRQQPQEQASSSQARRRRRRIRRIRREIGLSPLFVIGVFVDRFTLGITDLAFQITIHGPHFSSVQFGIRSLHLSPVGDICPCGYEEAKPFRKTNSSPLVLEVLPSGSASPNPSVSNLSTRESENGNRKAEANMIRSPFLNLGEENSSHVPGEGTTRDLFFAVLHTTGNKVTGDDAADGNLSETTNNQDQSSVLPPLSPSAYFSRFSEQSISNRHGAVWFDFVGSIYTDDPNLDLNKLPRLRDAQTEGVFESVYLRLLSNKAEFHLSPTSMHRLESVIRAIKNYPTYPSCRNSSTSAYSQHSVPSESHLALYRKHIPTRVTHLKLSSLTTFCFVEHWNDQMESVDFLHLQTGPIQLYSSASIYDREIAAVFSRWPFSSEIISKAYDYMSDTAAWQQAFGAPLAPGTLDKLLAAAFVRTRLTCNDVSFRLCLRSSHSAADDSLPGAPSSPPCSGFSSSKDLSSPPMFQVNRVILNSWNLNFPDYWRSHSQFPLLGESEIRLEVKPSVEFNLSLAGLSVGLCLLSMTAFQLQEFLDCIICSVPNTLPSLDSFKPGVHYASFCSQLDRRLVYSSPEDILRISLPGTIRGRLMSNAVLFILQLSVESGLSVRLWSPTRNEYLPVLERSRRSSDSGTGECETEALSLDLIAPLFGLSCQIPLDINSVRAPPFCHVVVGQLDALLSPKLFNWLASVMPTRLVPATQQFGSAHERAFGEGFYAPASSLSSFAPSVGRQSLTSHTTEQDIWNNVRRFLTGKGRLLQKIGVQASSLPANMLCLLTSPFRLSIVTQTNLPDSVVFLSNNSNPAPGASLPLRNANIVQLIVPRLSLCNKAGVTQSSFSQVLIPPFEPRGIVWGSWSVDQAFKQLPFLSPPSTSSSAAAHSVMVPWLLYLDNVRLMVGAHCVFATTFIATVAASLQARAVDSPAPETLVWCIHSVLSCDDPSVHSLPPAIGPSFEDVKEIVCAAHMMLTGFREVASKWGTIFISATTRRFDQSEIKHKKTPSDHIRPSRPYQWKSDPPHFPIPSPAFISKHDFGQASNNFNISSIAISVPSTWSSVPTYQRANLIPNLGLTLKTTAPAVAFRFQCGIRHLFTNFSVLFKDADPPGASINLSVNDISATLDLEEDFQQFEFKVGSYLISLWNAHIGTIPLLSPLESSLKPVHEPDPCLGRTPSSSKSPTFLRAHGMNATSTRSDFADSEPADSPLIFVNTSGPCRSDHLSSHVCQSSLRSDTVQAGTCMLNFLYRRSSFNTDTVADSSYSSFATKDSASSRKTSASYSKDCSSRTSSLLRLVVQPFDFTLLPELVEQFSHAFGSNLCLVQNDEALSASASQPASTSPPSPACEAETDKSTKETTSLFTLATNLQVTVKPFRVFMPLLEPLSLFKENLNQRDPNSLVLSCEGVRLGPLIDNKIQRPIAEPSSGQEMTDPHPTDSHSKSSDVRSEIAYNEGGIDNADPQYFVRANCLSLCLVCFQNTLFSDILARPARTPVHDTMLGAERQNPAQDWNQGARRSSWCCIPVTVKTWPLIQCFDLTVSFAPPLRGARDSSGLNTLGCALEVAIPGDLIVLADLTLLNSMLQFVKTPNYSTTPGDLAIKSGKPQSANMPNLFDQFFFSNDQSNDQPSEQNTPTRLLVTLRHIRLVSWSEPTEDSGSFGQLVVDLSHPHLIVNHHFDDDAKIADRIEVAVHDAQAGRFFVDLRLLPPSRLASYNNKDECRSFVKYTPVPREQSSVPITLILPSFLSDSSSKPKITRMHSPLNDCLLVSTGPSDPDPRTGIFKELFLVRLVRPMHSSVKFDVGPEIHTPRLQSQLSIQPDKQPLANRSISCQNRFKASLNVSRALHCVITPSIIRALDQLVGAFKSPDQTVDLATGSVNSANSSLALVHWLANRISVFSVSLYPIEVCFGISQAELNPRVTSLNQGAVCLRTETVDLEMVSIQLPDRSGNRVKWQLSVEGISLTCGTETLDFNRPSAGNILVETVSDANKFVHLLWPHAGFLFPGSVCLTLCPHHLASPVYIVGNVELSFRINAGLDVDLPLHGPVLNSLFHLISLYSDQLSQLSKKDTSNHTPGPVCDQCAGLPPLLYKDDLREESLLTVPSLSSANDTSGEPHQQRNATDLSPLLSPIHPCWPWVRKPDELNQLPLYTHPWPRYGQTVFCDNLKSLYYLSMNSNPIPMVNQSETADSFWVGVTWAYPHARLPVRIRVLPVPLEIIESYSTMHNPEGLELHCQLQYWDGLAPPRGRFVTYANFSLLDNLVVDLILVAKHQFTEPPSGHPSPLSRSPVFPHSQNDLDTDTEHVAHDWYDLQQKLDEFIMQQSPDTRPSSPRSTVPRTSNTSFEKVSSEIWRILVDLRARTSNNTNAVLSVQDMTNNSALPEPVALVHISPLTLAGSIQLDTIEDQSRAPLQPLIGRFYSPTVRITLLQQAHQSSSLIGGYPSGLELVRAEFSDVQGTYQASKLNYAPRLVQETQICAQLGRLHLQIADPNWAKVQPVLALSGFHARLNLPTEKSSAHLKLQLAKIHCLCAVDRLFALRCCAHMFIHFCTDLLKFLPNGQPEETCSGDSMTSNHTLPLDMVPLGWQVINHSDKVICVEQLGTGECLPPPKSSSVCPRVRTQPSGLFKFTINPGETKIWRPLFLPNLAPSKKSITNRIKLRVGVESSGRSSIWAEPVELAWPPCCPIGSNSNATGDNTKPFAFTLRWPKRKLDMNTSAESERPNLVFVCRTTGPTGFPGKLILHSDLVLRNLLPVRLACMIQPVSIVDNTASPEPERSDSSQTSYPKNQRVITLSTDLKEQYVCTHLPHRTNSSDIHTMSIKILSEDVRLMHANEQWWSDPFTFSTGVQGVSVQSQIVSQRSMVSVACTKYPNDTDSIRRLYAIITVDFKRFHPLAPTIVLITISPIFKVISLIPRSFDLQVKPIRRYVAQEKSPSSGKLSSSSNGPWIESVPSAGSSVSRLLFQSLKPDEWNLPQSVVTPFHLAQSPDLLLTATLPDGGSFLLEPVHLSPDGILTKLSSTFTSSPKDSMCTGLLTSKSQSADSYPYPIVYTYGSQLPACMLDSHDYPVWEDSLCYTLELVLRPELVLYNCCGTDLVIRLLPLEDQKVKYIPVTYALPNETSFLPPQTRSPIQFGFSSGGTIHWSSSALLISSPGSATTITSSLSSSSTIASETPVPIEMLNEEHKLHDLRITVGGTLICLLIRLLAENNPLRGEKSSPNYALSVESRVQLVHRAACPITIKPVLVPMWKDDGDGPTDVKSISAAALDGDIQIPAASTDHPAFVPIPRWSVCHPSLKIKNVRLTCCMLFSRPNSNSRESISWSKVVPLLELEPLSVGSPRLSDEIVDMVDHVCLPSTAPDLEVGQILVSGASNASCGRIYIRTDNIPPGGTRSLILSLTNHTVYNMAVDMYESPASSRVRHVQKCLENLFTDSLPTLPAHGGKLMCVSRQSLSRLSPMIAPDDRDCSVCPYDLKHLILCLYGHVTSDHMISTANGLEISLQSLWPERTPRTFLLPLVVNRELHRREQTPIVCLLTLEKPFGLSLTIFQDRNSIPHNLSELNLVHSRPDISVSVNFSEFSFSFLSSVSFHQLDRVTKHRYGTLSSSVCRMPPFDEFARFTLLGLSLVSSFAHRKADLFPSPLTQIDLQLSLHRAQLDNWAEEWEGTYDFPVVFSTGGSTMCHARLWITTECSDLVVPAFALFLDPPPTELRLEDTFFYDLHSLLTEYLFTVLSKSPSGTTHEQCVATCCNTHSQCMSDPIPFQTVYVERLQIGKVLTCVSLRAMLRFYLSCNEAPLELGAFDSHDLGTRCDIHGLTIRFVSLFNGLTVHYFTQAVFRAGWLVGSMDMLGNLTGLLYSFAEGVNDLVHLRPSRNQTRSPRQSEAILADEEVKALSLIVSDHPNERYMLIGIPDSATAENLTPPNSGLLRRFAGGINSLARNTSGGLVRSLTGIAVSVARNLDNLSLDPYHQQMMRHQQAPRGFTEGVQIGLSDFGLCLLGALAGVADHPLQAVFKALDSGPVGDGSIGLTTTLPQPPTAQTHFAWNALTGLGRGLIGFVVKPVAGAAELIAQTGIGLLRGTDLSSRSSELKRLNEAYTSSANDLLNRYLSLDSIFLRSWALETFASLSGCYGSLHLKDIRPASGEPSWLTVGILSQTAEQPGVSVVWLTTGAGSTIVGSVFNLLSDDSPPVLSTFLLPHSKDQADRLPVCDTNFNPATFVHIYSSIASEHEPKVPWYHSLEILEESFQSLLALRRISLEYDNSEGNLIRKETGLRSVCSGSGATTPEVESPTPNLLDQPPTGHGSMSRWQRVREYLMSTRSTPSITV